MTASLSEISGRDVVVPMSFSGTAIPGEDYALLDSSELVIPAGSLTGTLTFEVIDDDAIETAETIVVSMLASDQANLSAQLAQPTTAAFIISQNDAPVVSLDSAYQITAEGMVSAYLHARLSHLSDETIDVPFTVSGTATNGQDYQIVQGTFQFAPGSEEAELTVKIADDQIVEGTENLFVELLPTDNAILGASQTVLTDILDNDIVRVSFEPAGVSYYEGTENIPIKVTLSKVSTADTTIPIVVSGSAEAGGDFTISGTELLVQAGATEGYVYLDLTDDTLHELPETVFLELGDIVGGVAGELASISITIADADPYVSLLRRNRSISEGEDGLELAVILSAPTNEDIIVPLKYSGTARRGEDFAGPTSVTVPAGSTTQVFSLNIVDDLEVEAEESVNIVLGTSNIGIVHSPNTAAFTVQDNDVPPAVVWDSRNYRVAEEAGERILSLCLTHAATQDVTVTLMVVPAGATQGEDYELPPTSVTIPKGTLKASVSVPIVDDVLSEPSESFTVSIQKVTGAAMPIDPSRRHTTVMIRDTDRLTVASLQMLMASTMNSEFVESADALAALPSMRDVYDAYQEDPQGFNDALYKAVSLGSNTAAEAYFDVAFKDGVVFSKVDMVTSTLDFLYNDYASGGTVDWGGHWRGSPNRAVLHENGNGCWRGLHQRGTCLRGQLCSWRSHWDFRQHYRRCGRRRNRQQRLERH